MRERVAISMGSMKKQSILCEELSLENNINTLHRADSNFEQIDDENYTSIHRDASYYVKKEEADMSYFKNIRIANNLACTSVSKLMGTWENDYLDGNYYITAKVLEHIKPTVMVETASGNSHAMLDAGANLHVITRMHALQLGLVIHFNTSTAKIGTADSNNCLSIDG